MDVYKRYRDKLILNPRNIITSIIDPTRIKVTIILGNYLEIRLLLDLNEIKSFLGDQHYIYRGIFTHNASIINQVSNHIANL